MFVTGLWVQQWTLTTTVLKMKLPVIKRWTEPELERLEELYFDPSRFSQNVIAEKLGRPQGSVAVMIQKLELNRGSKRKQRRPERGTIIHPKPGVTVHIGNYGRWENRK